MLRNKMFRFNNQTKIFMSTSTENAINQKKLEHYKNLNSLEDSDAFPEGWDKAKPFDSIPGPKPLPLIGNIWRFLIPKFGEYYGQDGFELQKM